MLSVCLGLIAALVPWLGSGLGSARAESPATAPTTAGYWLVAADGGVFPGGGAPFLGSTGAIRLNQPIVGMAPTPTGAGYWMVASDGGIFSFGDAAFFGSTGAIRLNRPIVGMAATPTGAGYWLVASDGGIFSFGDAAFFGSTGAIRLNRPIVGMAATPTGAGYWLLASDGGLFAYGDAGFFGSAAASASAGAGNGFVALVPTPDNAGYWEVNAAGQVLPFGTAPRFADLPKLNSPIVGAAPFRPKPATTTEGTTGTTLPGGFMPVAKSRPNILFILLDDLRDEGIMDVAGVLPKTKQWLQAGGTTFTQAFTTTPLCCPERATIWSGRYGHNHGVFDNHLSATLDRNWIIPRYLHDAGYMTGLVGKYITGWHYNYEPPHFDAYSVFQGDYTDVEFWVKSPGDPAYHTEIAGYSTDYIGDKANGFIDAFEADDNRPWFMQVSPHAPHDIKPEGSTTSSCDVNALYIWPDRHDDVAVPPWTPTPAVTIEGNPAEKADKAPFLRDQRYSKECAAANHDGMLRTLLSADETVDSVMQKLQANGELDNTLVIFTTDNGYSWGERGMTSKGLPYTEHVKAPFLVRWDGVFPAGGTDDRLVGGEDFLPTYLQAAQYSPPEVGYPLDGRSFLPGQPGKAVKLLEFGPLDRPSPTGYEGHHNIPTWASIRTPGWQYIEYYGTDNTTTVWQEYYDLSQDPWELDNLVVTDPARVPDVAHLSAELRRYRTCAGTTGPTACP
ncbi:MAG TPA: sulfatase-like hydrolase/transferase [Acidimicrobiia bacterium]|nr:sulfatase-like hydrolase/transferase [Acidimicrobiia bacterium]